MEYGVQRDVFERLREMSMERKNLLVSWLSDESQNLRSSRNKNNQTDVEMELFAQEIALKSLMQYALQGPAMRKGDTINLAVHFPETGANAPVVLDLIVTYEGVVAFAFDSVMKFSGLEIDDNILKGMTEGTHFYRLPELAVSPLGFAVISYEAKKRGLSNEVVQRLGRIEKFFGSLLNAILEKGYSSVGGVFEALPIHRIQKNLSMSLFKSELLHQTSHTESAMDIFLKEIEGSFGVSFEECRKLLDFIGVTGRNTRWLSPQALYDLCYGSQNTLFKMVYPSQDDMIGRMYDYFSIQGGRKDRMFLTRRELTTRETTALRRSLKTKSGQHLSKEAYRNLDKRGKIFSYSFVPSRMSYEARQQSEKFVRTPSTDHADFLGAERYNRRLVFSLRAVIEFLMAENFKDEDVSSIVRPLFEHFQLQKFLLDDETIEWALLRIGDQKELQDVFLMRGLLVGQQMPNDEDERQKDIDSLITYFAAHPGIREGVEVTREQKRKFTARDLRKYAPDLSEIFDYPDRKIEEMGGIQRVNDKLMMFKERLFPNTRREVDVAVSRFVNYSRETFEAEVASAQSESIDHFEGIENHIRSLFEDGRITKEKYDSLRAYTNGRFLANGLFEDEIEELKKVMDDPETEYNGWVPLLNDKGEIKYD